MRAMRNFICACGNITFFRNTHCLACERALGYLPDDNRMAALHQDSQGRLHALAGHGSPDRAVRKCRNYTDHDVCNWLIPAEDDNPLCRACRLNVTIPDLDKPRHRELWVKLETAKRHMLYSIFQLNLPIIDRQEDPEQGLAFRFMADAEAESRFTKPIKGQKRVLTGHANGLITINLAEADDVARTRMREAMGERYRTLLGHFRHEVGHYFWQTLVANTDYLAPFRTLFGDERQDYGKAVKRHYDQGPPKGWRERFISAYASMHPWEDWAESWAHFLHMVDTLETGREFGFVDMRVNVDKDADFETLMYFWTTLSTGMNAVNRSMGLSDSYPFVLHAPAREKLRFVHDVIMAFGEQPLASMDHLAAADHWPPRSGLMPSGF